MLTTDWSGTYDYEKEEAEQEAEFYLTLIEDEDQDYVQKQLAKLVNHWSKILEPENLEEFCTHFNAKMPDQKYWI